MRVIAGHEDSRLVVILTALRRGIRGRLDDEALAVLVLVVAVRRRSGLEVAIVGEDAALLFQAGCVGGWDAGRRDDGMGGDPSACAGV